MPCVRSLSVTATSLFCPVGRSMRPRLHKGTFLFPTAPMRHSTTHTHTHTIERIETMEPTETERDDFRRGYVTAILWANAYREDEETGELVLDEDADYAYVTPGRWWENVGINLDDADSFLDDNIETLRRVATMHAIRWSAFESHGNDFALTRNGHGVGFWDHGYGEDGDVLSDVARAYG